MAWVVRQLMNCVATPRTNRPILGYGIAEASVIPGRLACVHLSFLDKHLGSGAHSRSRLGKGQVGAVDLVCAYRPETILVRRPASCSDYSGCRRYRPESSYSQPALFAPRALGESEFLILRPIESQYLGQPSSGRAHSWSHHHHFGGRQ